MPKSRTRKTAHDRGHGESSHVVWLGKSGIKDWDLMSVVLDGDWTLVTKNSYDFRGPADAPGSKGEFNKLELPRWPHLSQRTTGHGFGDAA